jgi:hypothetical protein
MVAPSSGSPVLQASKLPPGQRLVGSFTAAVTEPSPFSAASLATRHMTPLSLGAAAGSGRGVGSLTSLFQAAAMAAARGSVLSAPAAAAARPSNSSVASAATSDVAPGGAGTAAGAGAGAGTSAGAPSPPTGRKSSKPLLPNLMISTSTPKHTPEKVTPKFMPDKASPLSTDGTPSLARPRSLRAVPTMAELVSQVTNTMAERKRQAQRLAVTGMHISYNGNMVAVGSLPQAVLDRLADTQSGLDLLDSCSGSAADVGGDAAVHARNSRRYERVYPYDGASDDSNNSPAQTPHRPLLSGGADGVGDSGASGASGAAGAAPSSQPRRLFGRGSRRRVGDDTYAVGESKVDVSGKLRRPVTPQLEPRTLKKRSVDAGVVEQPLKQGEDAAHVAAVSSRGWLAGCWHAVLQLLASLWASAVCVRLCCRQRQHTIVSPAFMTPTPDTVRMARSRKPVLRPLPTPANSLSLSRSPSFSLSVSFALSSHCMLCLLSFTGVLTDALCVARCSVIAATT